MFLSAAMVCCYFTYVNTILPKEETDYSLRIIEEYVEPYYDSLTPNTGFTNINGISNVYVNMLADGFKVHKNDVSSDYIDLSFINSNGDAYRYYFEKISGKITFFYSDYERSDLGLSYIIERKE